MVAGKAKGNASAQPLRGDSSNSNSSSIDAVHAGTTFTHVHTKEVEPLLQAIYSAASHRCFLLEELERVGGEEESYSRTEELEEVRRDIKESSRRLRSLYRQQAIEQGNKLIAVRAAVQGQQQQPTNNTPVHNSSSSAPMSSLSRATEDSYVFDYEGDAAAYASAAAADEDQDQEDYN